MTGSSPVFRSARKKCLHALLLCICAFLLFTSQTGAQTPVVKAVLFFSPSCSHCQYVIEQVLPSILQKYGNSLQIIGMNVATEEGSALFNAAVAQFQLEQVGVPLLVVGDHVLMGSGEIPERFPALIDQYLAHGGVDWPAIPGLKEMLEASSTQQAAAQPSPSASSIIVPASPTIPSSPAPSGAATPGNGDPTPEASATLPVSGVLLEKDSPTSGPPAGLVLQESHSLGLAGRLRQDPAGNGLAILVLVGMITLTGWTLIRLSKTSQIHPRRYPKMLIPLLALVGLGVSAYLAFVETQNVRAVCGPVGDCNTVQQSEYARLFGVLPIGVVGVLGFAAIFIVWLLSLSGNSKIQSFAGIALRGMTLIGVFFSIYLTFLEPFVIGATCAWCLTVAMVITALFYLSWSSRPTQFD